MYANPDESGRHHRQGLQPRARGRAQRGAQPARQPRQIRRALLERRRDQSQGHERDDARAEDRRRAQGRSGLEARSSTTSFLPDDLKTQNAVAVARRPRRAARRHARSFPRPRRRPRSSALGPIDLDLMRGEFFAVVGPSGCGKSTLLEIIAGLNSPTDGSATLEGKPIAGEVPEGIGVVFQEDACFPWLDVDRQHRVRPAPDQSRRDRNRGARRSRAAS